MLYISRYCPDRTYGVVDTDDDVETIVDYNELFDAVSELGLWIEGAAINDGAVRTIHPVQIYQDARYCTKLQAKTKAILGVDIGLWRDKIVKICPIGSRVTKDAVLRMSDYASAFGDNVILSWQGGYYKHSVTLVFDDKIKCEGGMPFLGTIGFMFDFTEYSDDAFVNSLYLDLMRETQYELSELDTIVIDKPSRIDFWRHVGIIEGDYNPENEFLDDWYMVDLPTHEEYSKRIYEMYAEEFESILNMNEKFSFFSSLSNEQFIKAAEETLGGSARGMADCCSYDILRDKYRGVFNLTRFMTTLTSRDIMRLENYVEYFAVTEEFEDKFVKWCNNVAVMFMDYCKSRGVEV